ncbi:MAG TPA: J domain-containing protein [Nitrososphaera sp.]|nr:J domain-containing protein [Nitrososphaera sp.]
MEFDKLSPAGYGKIIAGLFIVFLAFKSGNDTIAVLAFFSWWIAAGFIASNDLKRQKEQQRADFFRFYQQQSREQQETPRAQSTQNEAILDFHYAQVLELDNRRDSEFIRSQYRRLIKLYHPDKASWLDPQYAELFKQRAQQLNEAYEYFSKKNHSI